MRRRTSARSRLGSMWMSLARWSKAYCRSRSTARTTCWSELSSSASVPMSTNCSRLPMSSEERAHPLRLLQAALEGEDLVDGLEDLGAKAQHRFHDVAGGVLEVVERRAVEGIHHGHGHAPPVEAHRHQQVLARERLRHDGGEGARVELERVDAHECGAGGLAEQRPQLGLVHVFPAREAAGQAERRDQFERGHIAVVAVGAGPGLLRERLRARAGVGADRLGLGRGDEVALLQQGEDARQGEGVVTARDPGARRGRGGGLRSGGHGLVACITQYGENPVTAEAPIPAPQCACHIHMLRRAGCSDRGRAGPGNPRGNAHICSRILRARCVQINFGIDTGARRRTYSSVEQGQRVMKRGR